MPTAATRQLRPDSLLRDIASLDARFRAALGDWRRIDRVRGFGGPNSPYDDFAPKLARLFERARMTFDQGKMSLARDAYGALFATLALKDDYGFALPRPKSISICDEQVRYLRAVGETAPVGKRGVELTERMHDLRRSLWERCKLTIQSLLESAPMPQDVREAWLDELVAALRHDREREADRWLREAVQWRRTIWRVRRRLSLIASPCSPRVGRRSGPSRFPAACSICATRRVAGRHKASGCSRQWRGRAIRRVG